MVGIPECANRIAKMVETGKSDGKIPKNVKLKTLGLSLSGCEQVSSIMTIDGFDLKKLAKISNVCAILSSVRYFRAV